MVKKEMSLKDLKTQLAKAKSDAKLSKERADIEAELRSLRSAKSNKFAKRLGRGFIVLTSKAGKATGKGIRAARKFAEETQAGEGLNVDLRRGSAPARTSTARRTRRNLRPTIVKRRTTTIKTTTRRRLKKKPGTKRRPPIRQPLDNDFGFGIDF